MNMDPEGIYEIVREHGAELLEAASWRDQVPLPEPDADAHWSIFGDERRHTRHRRRLFIARFNPNIWGDPRVPELWRDGHEESWLWDAYGPGWGKPANSSQALRAIRAGDLIVPQRNDGADGRLVGLWVAVLVNRWIDPASPPRELWPRLSSRMATVVTHVPVVRFTREVVVPVARRFDKSLDSDQTFTLRNQNHVEVADPDGGRTSAARLLAACSLPVELLTCTNPLDMRERLARELTGMKDEHHRYWKDMRYKHELRTAIEDAAVARSRAVMLQRGYDFPDSWDHQTKGGWGGDYECWPTTSNGQRLAIEVKGTSRDKWFGRVKLERSQYDRAVRNANGRPWPEEEGYGWELHVQPGIPLGAVPVSPATLPDLEVRSSTFVRDKWPQQSVG